MFGGAGLYRNGKMFGDRRRRCYLKVDDSNRADFVSRVNPFNPFPDKVRPRLPAMRFRRVLEESRGARPMGAAVAGGSGKKNSKHTVRERPKNRSWAQRQPAPVVWRLITDH